MSVDGLPDYEDVTSGKMDNEDDSILTGLGHKNEQGDNDSGTPSIYRTRTGTSSTAIARGGQRVPLSTSMMPSLLRRCTSIVSNGNCAPACLALLQARLRGT